MANAETMWFPVDILRGFCGSLSQSGYTLLARRLDLDLVHCLLKLTSHVSDDVNEFSSAVKKDRASVSASAMAAPRTLPQMRTRVISPDGWCNTCDFEWATGQPQQHNLSETTLRSAQADNFNTIVSQ